MPRKKEEENRGRPTAFDEKLLPDILDSIVFAQGSLGQVADLNGINRRTFYEWMKYGEIDQYEGKDTNFALFSRKIRLTQAKVVMELFRKAEERKNYPFYMWWLGKICREDFGDKCQTIEELKQIIIDLLEKEAKHG